MGVPGLTGFIDDSGNVLCAHRLHDTRVIIDGNNLYYYLYYNSQASVRYGGDYDCYARCIKEFFTTLLKCNISPHIVLDGANELDDRKLNTIINRAQQRIQRAELVSREGRGNILPILAYEVFLKTLQEMQIPHITCLYEADEEIASLAVQWNCPVISSDSDFYIFNLPGGYLPMGHIDFNAHHSDHGYFYLQCKIYTVNHFSKCFHIDVKFMPLFATLQGNDVINCELLEQFYKKLNITQTRSSKIVLTWRETRDAKIEGLIHWLAHLASPQEAIYSVLECLPGSQRDHVSQLVNTSVQSYDTNKTGLSDNFTGAVTVSGQSDTHIAIGGCNLPMWFMEKFYHCELVPLILNATLSRGVFISCQVEAMDEINAGNCAQELRRIMYGILLGRRCDDSEVSHGDVTVEEYSRFKETLTKSKIFPSSVNKSGTTVPSLDKIPEMSYQQRTEFLLESLGGDIGNVEEDMKLIISVVVYWVSHANPKVTKEHVMALLVGMIRLAAIYPGTIGQKGTSETIKNARRHLAKFTAPPPTHDATTLCKMVHGFSQFQSCLLSAIHLNKVLDTDLPTPNVSEVYNGTFLYNFTTELHRCSNPELYIHELLGTSSQLTELYDSLLATIMSLVGEDCFVKTSSKRGMKKSKKATSQKTRDKVKDTSKNVLCNRFAALDMTDE